MTRSSSEARVSFVGVALIGLLARVPLFALSWRWLGQFGDDPATGLYKKWVVVFVVVTMLSDVAASLLFARLFRATRWRDGLVSALARGLRSQFAFLVLAAAGLWFLVGHEHVLRDPDPLVHYAWAAVIVTSVYGTFCAAMIAAREFKLPAAHTHRGGAE